MFLFSFFPRGNPPSLSSPTTTPTAWVRGSRPGDGNKFVNEADSMKDVCFTELTFNDQADTSNSRQTNRHSQTFHAYCNR